mmetsp:Transcript_99925/g.282808  ORF Transcript_99925/g.282808 Transcript_99925/m.282808 type:complete len:317 (+) Transcript_99925:121-1071(+)
MSRPRAADTHVASRGAGRGNPSEHAAHRGLLMLWLPPRRLAGGLAPRSGHGQAQQLRGRLLHAGPRLGARLREAYSETSRHSHALLRHDCGRQVTLVGAEHHLDPLAAMADYVAMPSRQIVKRFFLCLVVHEKHAVAPTIECTGYVPEAFWTRCVPYLRAHDEAVAAHREPLEVNADGGDVTFGVRPVHEPVHDRRLAHARVPHQQELDVQVVVRVQGASLQPGAELPVPLVLAASGTGLVAEVAPEQAPPHLLARQQPPPLGARARHLGEVGHGQCQYDLPSQPRQSRQLRHRMGMPWNWHCMVGCCCCKGWSAS